MPIQPAQIKNMKVDGLRQTLKARGLDGSGVKAQLAERLKAHCSSGADSRACCAGRAHQAG
jgi:hypothetical protein